MLARMRLKNVHRVIVKGKPYYYHRPTRTRLQSRFGTPEFVAEVQALNEKLARRTVASKRTLGALIKEYRAAPEFTDLRASSRKQYGWHLEFLSAVGDTPITAIDTAYCIALRDIIYAKHKRIKANMMLTIIGILWAFGRPRGFTKGEPPTQDVKRIERPKRMKKQNRAWTDAEFSAFIENCSEAMRRAAILGRYTALREGDIVRMPWAWYDGTRILVAQEKTGDQVWMKAHPEVRRLLDGIPRTGKLVVLGEKGQTIKPEHFSSYFWQQKKQLNKRFGFPMDVTFHGLRTTVATVLADSGADERTIAGVTGHRDLKSVRIYTEEANRKRANERAIDMLQSVKSSVKSAAKH